MLHGVCSTTAVGAAGGPPAPVSACRERLVVLSRKRGLFGSFLPCFQAVSSNVCFSVCRLPTADSAGALVWAVLRASPCLGSWC